MVTHAFGFTLMVGLMMAPTVTPWVRAFHRFSPQARTSLFALGYLAVWTVFGVLLALVHGGISLPAWAGPASLLLAGLFQFTPLKQACLTHCRNPLTFLLARWKNGPAPAFTLGANHGLYCLGCCWALMLTMVTVGMASMWWMAALTVFTFAEQVMPGGHRLRAPAGALLIVAGLAGLT